MRPKPCKGCVTAIVASNSGSIDTYTQLSRLFGWVDGRPYRDRPEPISHIFTQLPLVLTFIILSLGNVYCRNKSCRFPQRQR